MLASVIAAARLPAQSAADGEKAAPAKVGVQPEDFNRPSWPKQIDDKFPLENSIQVSARIYTGGEPKGAKDFLSLKNLGIKTIVSVDGHPPDLVSARKFGIRYVHIPVGYGGISKHAQLSLARVSQDIRGKLYVHCHHGKHRGPAAAAILCQIDDARSSVDALEILKSAGTAKRYAGLWNSVKTFKKPHPQEQLPKLLGTVPQSDFESSMSDIDRQFEKLKRALRATDALLVDQIQSARESTVVLSEQFRELGRIDEQKDVGFVAALSSQERTIKELEKVLTTENFDQNVAQRTIERNAILERLAHVESACAACHRQHRD